MTRGSAVVLGAGPGIGLAIGRRFAREGYEVALVARPNDPLHAFLGELEALGARARVLGADLGDPAALATALAAIEAWGGHPEVLVCNASAGAPGPVEGLSPADLQRTLQVNLAAPVAAVQWALPAMRKAGRGSLLFTGGGLAQHPRAGMAAPCAGKAALRSLALCLGEELAPEGLHAALVSVSGFVQAGSALDADRVARAFWDLHRQERARWVHEVVLE